MIFKNMATVMFLKTAGHVEALEHLDYFRRAVWRHFKVLFIYLFTSECWLPFTSIVWEVTAAPFPCETPAVF